jgi:hypothetical protein
LELGKGLAWLHQQGVVIMPGISYGIGIDVNGSQVVEHFFCRNETSLRVLVVPGLQVLLGVAARTIEQVKHFVLLILVVVGIAPEFALDLELPAEESGVLSV